MKQKVQHYLLVGLGMLIVVFVLGKYVVGLFGFSFIRTAKNLEQATDAVRDKVMQLPFKIKPNASSEEMYEEMVKKKYSCTIKSYDKINDSYSEVFISSNGQDTVFMKIKNDNADGEAIKMWFTPKYTYIESNNDGQYGRIKIKRESIEGYQDLLGGQYITSFYAYETFYAENDNVDVQVDCKEGVVEIEPLDKDSFIDIEEAWKQYQDKFQNLFKGTNSQ